MTNEEKIYNQDQTYKQPSPINPVDSKSILFHAHDCTYLLVYKYFQYSMILSLQLKLS